MNDEIDELVLRVSVEGGGADLYRSRRVDGTWRFTLGRSNGDNGYDSPEQCMESRISINDWMISGPNFVHPEYQQAIWRFLQPHFEEKLNSETRYVQLYTSRSRRWKQYCGIETSRSVRPNIRPKPPECLVTVNRHELFAAFSAIRSERTDRTLQKFELSTENGFLKVKLQTKEQHVKCDAVFPGYFWMYGFQFRRWARYLSDGDGDFSFHVSDGQLFLESSLSLEVRWRSARPSKTTG